MRSFKQRVENDVVSLSTLVGYVAPRFGMQLGDMANHTIMLTYSEVLGMNIALIATLRTVIKSIDILFGFVIGYASDQCVIRL